MRKAAQAAGGSLVSTYTEEEAKTKGCVRVAPVADHPQMKCAGTACMGWRWQAGAFIDYGSMKARNVSNHIVPAKGFCGLAGGPE